MSLNKVREFECSYIKKQLDNLTRLKDYLREHVVDLHSIDT
jgi:hypothetical protein